MRGPQVDLAQLPRAERRAGAVAAADPRALGGEVLGDHGDVLAVDPLAGPGALHAAHGRLDQQRRDGRVLAEALLGPAPAGVAQHVEAGDEQQVRAALPGLRCDGRAELLGEGGVHARAEREVHRQGAPAERHQAVRRLLDEQHRQTVAAGRDVVLHGGVGLGAALGRHAASPAHRGPRVRAEHAVERADPAEAVHLGAQHVGDLRPAVHPAHGLPALEALVDLAREAGDGESRERPARGGAHRWASGERRTSSRYP